MDWIRRNWPDLLIGLALLAVIAGIIATLLNGGSFLSGGARTPTSPSAASATTQPQPDTPADPTATDPVTNDPAATGSAVDADAATGNLAPQPGTQNTTQDATQNTVVPSIETTPLDGTAGSPGTSADIPVIPSSGDATPANPAVTAPPVAPAAATTTGSGEVGSRTASEAESAYRIVVGSFGNVDNALRRAQTFADANFPTFTATQGDLTLVLVGPYDNQNDADNAFSRIQSEGLEASPLLFAPAGDGGVTTTPTDTTEAAPGTATPAPSQTGTVGAVTDNAVTDNGVVTGDGGVGVAGDSYLQTGAYGSSASAQPQRERLEGLGFNVSEVQEGSFVKLLVGPFSADELGDAQSRLSAQGIDYFVRSN